MSANAVVIKEWATTYSTPELLGMMTVAMIIALLLISLGFRLIRTVSVIRKYDEACEKVKTIEEKCEEMKNALVHAELEYQKSLTEMTQIHSRECFDLQQIIFDRNGEIIDLKNKLLKLNINSPI